MALSTVGATAQPEEAPPPRRPVVTPTTKPVPAAAPGQFAVTIEGAKQGRFKGEGTTDANRDRIIGVRFDSEVHLPRDDKSQYDTAGRRRHAPIVFCKEWGAASPQLFQAAATGETLRTVVFDFYRLATPGATAGAGANELFYRITLTGARVASVRQFTDGGRFFEDVGIVFDRIDVEHRPSKTAAGDDNK